MLSRLRLLRRQLTPQRNVGTNAYPKKTAVSKMVADLGDGEYVLETFVHLYIKVIAYSLLVAGSMYLTSRYWKSPNKLGRETVTFDPAKESIDRFAIDKSYSLYTKYLESGKLLSPTLKTHEVLTSLLDKLVASAITLGATELKEKKWRIHLVDDVKISITALPNGNIFISKGLILQFEDIDCVASILAHEIAHIHANHFEDIYARSLMRGYSILPLFLIPIGGVRDEGLFETILKASFGYEEETEADIFATKMLTNMGLDPQYYTTFWETIQALRKEEKNNKKHLSLERHSFELEKRIQNMEKEINLPSGASEVAKE